MSGVSKGAIASDVFELARRSGVIEGQVPFDAAPRLRADLSNGSGAIDFRLEGRIDEQGRPAARLFLRTDLPLLCDRCARPFALHVEHEGTFYFVDDDAELTTLPVSADEEAEPLLGSEFFDVGALVEDETILCLPVSPRHGECPSPSTGDHADAPAGGARENPFAVLQGLLREKKP